MAEMVCENCRNWQQIGDVPHRNRCTQLITKKGILYNISSAKHLETEHLQTWPAFACPQFAEFPSGPFFLKPGTGIRSGYSDLYMQLPGQEAFRIINLVPTHALGICDGINRRWLTQFGNET